MCFIQEIPKRLNQLQGELRQSQSKLLKEKQKYFNLWSKHKELQTLHSEHSVKALEETPRKDEDSLVGKDKEFDRLLLLDDETMSEVTKLHLIIEDVIFALDKVKAIKKYWSVKVCIYTHVKQGNVSNICTACIYGKKIGCYDLKMP